jgi:hypothetical protein
MMPPLCTHQRYLRIVRRRAARHGGLIIVTIRSGKSCAARVWMQPIRSSPACTRPIKGAWPVTRWRYSVRIWR